jgi:hypothetical protein
LPIVRGTTNTIGFAGCASVSSGEVVNRFLIAVLVNDVDVCVVLVLWARLSLEQSNQRSHILRRAELKFISWVNPFNG